MNCIKSINCRRDYNNNHISLSLLWSIFDADASLWVMFTFLDIMDVQSRCLGNLNWVIFAFSKFYTSSLNFLQKYSFSFISAGVFLNFDDVFRCVRTQIYAQRFVSEKMFQMLLTTQIRTPIAVLFETYKFDANSLKRKLLLHSHP